MRTLLIGEYSHVHATLAEGLRALGLESIKNLVVQRSGTGCHSWHIGMDGV